jgi:hypothetical protein
MAQHWQANGPSRAERYNAASRARTEEENVNNIKNAISPKITTRARPTASQLLAEGVDSSEGGWATDIAASLVGLLYLITALVTYENEFLHFAFFFGGTFVAHLFGGLAHRYFPNRASDGTGQVGFYIAMMIGYGGNCVRYGLGWGLLEDGNDDNAAADNDEPGSQQEEFQDVVSSWPNVSSILAWIALGNLVYLLLTGLYVIWQMRITQHVTDDAVESLSFHPDILFGIGETFTAIMENVAPLIFLWFNRDRLTGESGLFLIAAIVFNVIGWAAVYLSAFFYLTVKLEYNPNLMQRIFHYCMIAMMWSIDMHVRTTISEREE